MSSLSCRLTKRVASWFLFLRMEEPKRLDQREAVILRVLQLAHHCPPSLSFVG